MACLVLELGDISTGFSLAELLCRLDPVNAAVFYQAAKTLTEGA